jgi:2-iminobutanoate/2-iminopropanoate deaminase
MKPLALSLLSAAIVLSATAVSAQQPAPARSLPFSPGLQLGDTLYVSGHLGITDPAGDKSVTPEQEATLVLDSVDKTLKEANMTMDDLVYVEIYCTDLTLYATFNKVYAARFRTPYPARDFIGVKDLLFGNHFEVMGIAVRHAAANKKQPTATP